MKKRTATIAVALALAAGATASAITVTQRLDTINVFAERVDLSQLVLVGASRILPAPAELGPLGTTALPVEMGTTFSAARTGIARDQWTYTVEVKEARGNALASGALSVTLLVDGTSVGTVYVEQRSAEAGVEGTLVTFNLGPSLLPSSLYYVEVKPYAPSGPVVEYTVRSVAGPEWKGVGGAINNAPNPTLTVGVGGTIRITAKNDDGGTHNIGIRDGAGNVITPPGWSTDIDAAGEEATIAWSPSSAGTYTYVCKYHPNGMEGTLTVT